MTDKLVWRLSDLPTGMDVAELVAQKIITPEEAKEILFSSEDSEETSKKIKQLETDVKAKDEEIKFLRDLTDKLAAKSNGWPTVIREYYDYRPRYPRWYNGYSDVMLAANTNIKDNGSYTLTTSGTGKSTVFNAGPVNAVMSVSTNMKPTQLLSILNDKTIN